jgi:hypothetical protein
MLQEMKPSYPRSVVRGCVFFGSKTTRKCKKRELVVWQSEEMKRLNG